MGVGGGSFKNGKGEKRVTVNESVYTRRVEVRTTMDYWEKRVLFGVI